MELSGYSYSFAYAIERGEIDTAGTIRFHAELGIRANELTDSFINDDDIPEIMAALAETGSTVSCYDVYSSFVEPDGAPSPADLGRVQKGLDRAATLGARRVLIVPSETNPNVPPERIRQHYAEVIKSALPAARRLGLTLMTANLGSAAAINGKVDHLKEVIAITGPEVKVTYDVGNYVMAAEDTIAALDQVAPLMEHVHLKDWTIKQPGSATPVPGGFPATDGSYYYSEPLGDGVVPLPEAIGRLRGLGYTGYLSVEYEGQADPKAALRKGVTYLRTLLDPAPAAG